MSNFPNDGGPGRRLSLLRKRIAILPTLCTLANAGCGLAAIVFAAGFNVAGEFPRETALYISGWLIFAAMVFDLFDGFIARRTKTASNFGAELDSLCDGISFGAAPAFLLLQLGDVFAERRIKEVFLLVAMLYMMCALLRLARFNVQTDLDAKSHRVFRGLPSPAAAGAMASLVVLRNNIQFDPRLAPDAIVNPVINVLAPAGALLVALLMVSRVPYIHAANRILHRRFNFSRLVQFMLVVFALVLLREFALVIGFWSYALWGPVRMLLAQAGLTRLADSTETNENAPAATIPSPPLPPAPHVHRVS